MNTKAGTTIIGEVPESLVILPSQWGHKKDDPYANERLLWINVLYDAIHCLGGRGSEPGGRTSYRSTRQWHLALDAKLWFASDEMYLGSFLCVCEWLDLDAAQVRKTVARGLTVQRRTPVDSKQRIMAPRLRNRQHRVSA